MLVMRKILQGLRGTLQVAAFVAAIVSALVAIDFWRGRQIENRNDSGGVSAPSSARPEAK